MPNQPPHLRKKKKGPAPAHQNSFAFVHNAKSKKTDAILSSPNIHVCRRCHDKIEWRKRYRKYKPRTQPGTCNACQQRNVLAAYHTICTNCTVHSAKAKQVLQAYAQEKHEKQLQRQERGEHGDDDDDDEEEEQEQMENMEEDGDDDDDADEIVQENQVESNNVAAVAAVAASTTDASTAPPTRYYRVCAMCVKEPALRDGDDEDDPSKQRADTDETRRLRLRERKTIERQLERQEQQAKQAAKEARRRARLLEEGGAGVTTDSNDKSKMEVDGEDRSVSDEEEDLLGDSGDDPDDPFLQAIGGADKLLVGEAYQQQLLRKMGESTKTA